MLSTLLHKLSVMHTFHIIIIKELVKSMAFPIVSGNAIAADPLAAVLSFSVSILQAGPIIVYHTQNPSLIDPCSKTFRLHFH